MRSCANLVVAEVSEHYKKACVPVLHEKKNGGENYRITLTLHYSLFKIIPEKRNGHRKVEEFQEKLKQTMPFWPRDAERRMENEKRGKSEKEVEAINENILFLRSMKTGRIAHYATKDEEFVKAVEARSLRKQSVDKALLKQNTVTAADTTTWNPYSSSESSTQESEAEEPTTSTLKRSHKRVVKKGTTIFIPHDVLKHPSLVSFNARNKLSTTAISNTIETLMSVCDGDPSAVSLHYSTAHR